MGITVRRMSAGEARIAIEWAADEGWNPGFNDAPSFYRADPEGFLLAELEGEPVGCIATVGYGDGFGFVGLYIVRPEFRGRGFGLRLWEAGMAHLGARNAGADGVPAQVANYERSGFRYAHRNTRYAFEGAVNDGHPGLADLASIPFEQVAAYDRIAFPAPRTEFLSDWITQPGARGLGLVRDGALAGFGVVRACREGSKIGPLFADDEAAAETLFAGLVEAAGEGPVFIDAPEPNPAARRLAERHAMEPVFESARMYTHEEPAIDLGRVYGVTTFELG